jgi:hypothetical protein
MLLSIAAAALALQAGLPLLSHLETPRHVEPIQYRAYAHPPPCGHGFDLSARDGLCYPNGFLARPLDNTSIAGIAAVEIPMTTIRAHGAATITTIELS